jgi:hypothetical protein
MKLLIATVALATMIAAPALAQSNGNRTRADQQNLRGANQVNQLSRTDNGQRHSTNPTHDVYDGSGHYVGSDPDARIRHTILSDRPGE